MTTRSRRDGSIETRLMVEGPRGAVENAVSWGWDEED